MVLVGLCVISIAMDDRTSGFGLVCKKRGPTSEPRGAADSLVIDPADGSGRSSSETRLVGAAGSRVFVRNTEVLL